MTYMQFGCYTFTKPLPILVISVSPQAVEIRGRFLTCLGVEALSPFKKGSLATQYICGRGQHIEQKHGAKTNLLAQVFLP